MSRNTPDISPPAAEPASAASNTRAGLLYGITAYAWWGLIPGYFKLIAHIPATIVLGHRIVWSLLLLAALVSFRRAWPEVRAIARTRRTHPWLLLSTALIGANWLIFIYAVAASRLVEASLGYFINPLVTLLLGMIFLGERLRPAQWVAAALAAVGVAYLTFVRGGLPWIAVIVPITFGLYGLVRKRSPVGPLTGVFIETALLSPLAAAYLAWSHLRAPAPEDLNAPATIALLSLSGVATTVPLLCFVAGAQRLRLVTMGFLQYISPILQLLTAVLIFGEPFGPDRATTFALIWAALALFVADSVRRARTGPDTPA